MGLIGSRPKKTTWKHPTLGVQPFRGHAVEVEAIDAPVLRGIVDDAIGQHVDPRQLELLKQQEQREREGLRAMAEGWAS
jgi:hypothetical protein